ncbi:MAG: family 2 glycosyl transferase [Lachnospiraceae bacterium]|nr:family 2 glycosyl transferase [Lachnospiraceae bacterium]
MRREKRNHNRIAGGVLCLTMALSAGCGQKQETPADLYQEEQQAAAYGFRAGEKYLEVYDGEAFRPVYLKGVNIGSGVPGHFPGELAITKETYARWLDEIAQMHCNTVRIYTTMMPCFYEALLEHNQKAEEPLYLIMGVWYDEETAAEEGDAFALLDGAVAEAQEQIDIIHGQAEIPQRSGKAWGKYTADVSPYVLGWILGIEPDAHLVGTTNAKYPEIDGFDGTYLMTEGTDAFHAFLCELGERVIAYETEGYGMQRPVSWTNWPTADALSHPAEPTPEKEDAVSVNVELIRAKESFAPGIFASYHVYPYYPDFMFLEPSYGSFQDGNGNINTYEAYLRELIGLHDIPVLVAEFGVPSSRGCTHINPLTGLDQGNLNETEQGWCLDSMARDICNNGFAGGLVFSWQDEWFKRTWNTMDYSNADRRAFWNDVQTSEQAFGLMEFLPGDGSSVLDGSLSDWQETDRLLSADGYTLWAKADARYLWLAVQAEEGGLQERRLVLPLDITPASGAAEYDGMAFPRAVDFVIDLNGTEDSHVYVQHYYDRYAFFYRKYDNLLDVSGYDDPDGTAFGPVYLSLNKMLKLPGSDEVIDATKYDSGLLRCGTADPAEEAYDSLADFCYQEDCVELRIPWGLLNFRDPSSKEIEDDFWAKGMLQGRTVSEIWLGVCAEGQQAQMARFTWADWDTVEYTERLKDSYGILQACFGELQIRE